MDKAITTALLILAGVVCMIFMFNTVYPMINRSSQAMVSMAEKIDGGLLAPVIRQVDQKSIVEVAQEAIKLANQVRIRRFKLDVLQGGTLTVTNAGMYGTDFVTPLITVPQSAAFGVGRLVPKPVVRDNQIVVRTIMGLSLTYDHRVITGATAAQFFQTLQNTIENPAQIDLRIS